MYGLHGEHQLTEMTLNHLEGYKRSRPVRIAQDRVRADRAARAGT